MSPFHKSMSEDLVEASASYSAKLYDKSKQAYAPKPVATALVVHGMHISDIHFLAKHLLDNHIKLVSNATQFKDEFPCFF